MMLNANSKAIKYIYYIYREREREKDIYIERERNRIFVYGEYVSNKKEMHERCL